MFDATYWRTQHSFRAFKEETGFQVLSQIRVLCCAFVVVNVYVSTCSFSNHAIPCAVRTTGLYEHNIILLKMSVTHYELPVVCTSILHQNGYPVPKSRTQR